MQKESSYTVAYRAVCTLYQETGRPLTKDEVQSRLESTPGMVFIPGTTIENVLDTMEHWRLIKRTYKGKSRERITPLEQESLLTSQG